MRERKRERANFKVNKLSYSAKLNIIWIKASEMCACTTNVFN